MVFLSHIRNKSCSILIDCDSRRNWLILKSKFKKVWGVIWYNESFVTLFGFGHRLSSSDYAVYINFTQLKTAVNSCSPSPKSSRHVASLLKVGGGGDASKTSWQAKKTLQDHENLRQEVGGTHPMLHVCQRFKCNAFPYKIFSLPPVIKQMKKILKL